MITLHQIVVRARNRMENGRLDIREKRPPNVTWQQYEYWPRASFEMKDGGLYYVYRGWAGKALPHVHDCCVKITRRMIDEDDFSQLRHIRDDWVLKGLGFKGGMWDDR